MQNFKLIIVNFLKDKVVALALKKLLKGATGGFKVWLVTYIIEELFEEIAEPILRLAIRKGALVIDKAQGNIKVVKIEQAKSSGNESDYTSAIGGV